MTPCQSTGNELSSGECKDKRVNASRLRNTSLFDKRFQQEITRKWNKTRHYNLFHVDKKGRLHSEKMPALATRLATNYSPGTSPRDLKGKTIRKAFATKTSSDMKFMRLKNESKIRVTSPIIKLPKTILKGGETYEERPAWLESLLALASHEDWRIRAHWTSRKKNDITDESANKPSKRSFRIISLLKYLLTLSSRSMLIFLLITYS